MPKKTQSEKFATLLYNNPSFQKDIIAIRRLFDIPANGFMKVSEAEVFVKKFSDDSLKKSQSHQYVKAVRSLRADLDMAKISKKVYSFKIRELESDVPQFRMDNKIKNLMNMYKISKYWDFALFNHIVTSERSWSQSCVPGIFSLGEGNAEIRVTIDANATLDDLKAIWPTIREFQKRLPDYRGRRLRMPVNMERDSFIVELKSQGLNNKQIVTEVNKRYPKNMIGYEYVPVITKRYRLRT